LLEAMPPYQGGGDMIEQVTFEKTTYAKIPHRFEAGTPHISGAVGLAAAVDYLNAIGLENAAAHEHALFAYAAQKLAAIPGLRPIGSAKHKASVLSFVIDDPPMSALDVGLALDAEGIAVRTGHHCCQPVMSLFNVPATIRASIALYNTKADIDALATALEKIRGGRLAKTKKAEVESPRNAAVKTDDAIRFPAVQGDSPQAAADELAETLEFLGDETTRTQFILELGEKLPQMPEPLKTEATRVHGCMSVVHLFGRRKPGTTDALEFIADSDAHIVKGLIAVLQRLFSGHRSADILSFDVEAFFRRIDLDKFISSQRRNGLAGMVQRVRSLAAAIAKG
jgi:cysteine desulfurase/selenocysteine lyase